MSTRPEPPPRPPQPRRARGALVGALVGAGVGWLALAAPAAVLASVLSAELDLRALGALLGAPLGSAVGAAASGLLATRSGRRWISPWGLGVTLVAVPLWFIPVAHHGLMDDDIPGYPGALRNLYRVSCLFTSSSSSWRTYHYEVRYIGRMEWQEGPEEGFFDLTAYGFRTRLNRLVRQSERIGTRGERRRQELAIYIQQRWSERFPDAPRVGAVRFSRVSHPVRGDVCMAEGAWARPALSALPPESKVTVIDTVVLPMLPRRGAGQGAP